MDSVAAVTEWTQDTVSSGIVVYGGGDIVKGQTSGFSCCSHRVDTVHSGHSMQWMQYAVE